MSRKLLKGVQCVVGLFLCLCGLGSWVYVKLAAWETFGDVFAIAGLEFDMSNIKFFLLLVGCVLLTAGWNILCIAEERS